MPISRRSFLRAGGVAVVAAGTTGGLNALAAERGTTPEAAASQPGETTHALMSKATFAAHLRTVFNDRADERREVPVELFEIRDCGPAERRAGQECFALTFRARTSKALKQNTYQMEHRALGRFDLFIAPVKSEKHGRVYEAVINHVRA